MIEDYKKEARTKEEFLVCTRLLPAIRDQFSSHFDLLKFRRLCGSTKAPGPMVLISFGITGTRHTTPDGANRLGAAFWERNSHRKCLDF